MEILTHQDLQDVLNAANGHVVSIYLPLDPTKPDTRPDRLRLKHLIGKAADALHAAGETRLRVREKLEPATDLLVDEDFWRVRARGVAIFLAHGFFRMFRTPIDVDEQAVVARQFDITPLVPLLMGHEPFYVLAVSQKHVKLLSGNRYSEHVVEVEGLPQDIVAALNYQPPHHMFQAHLWVHAPAGSPSGRVTMAIHGQGGASDFAKEEVLEFFRLIDRALHPFLREKRSPLIFAGVDYLYPIYRKANSYAHLADVHIGGNPDLWSEHQLHERALEILQPQFDQPIDDALRRASEQAQFDRAAYELPKILRAARDGRVDTLLVARSAKAWGSFDPTTDQVQVPDTVQPSAESEDLVNRAVIDTLRGGGKIHVVDPARLPHGSPIAALFRYAVSPVAASAAHESR